MCSAVSTYFVPAPLLPPVSRCTVSPGRSKERACGRSRREQEEQHEQRALLAVCGVFACAFAVDHAGHLALGHVIGSRTVAGLAEEDRHLEGASLRQLVKAGASVGVNPVEVTEVAYTGDTRARGLTRRLVVEGNGCGEHTPE